MPAHAPCDAASIAFVGSGMNHISLGLDHDHVRFGKDVTVTFQRTLRIPDDGRTYPLPPGLGSFPIRRVDDYRHRLPTEIIERGGVFLPMYQREAMWLSFGAKRPHALQIGLGKVSALTGKPWSDSLDDDPQNYVVPPHQPWLDGIIAADGKVRQFVAMPLGLGYTVEGQVTGEETFGGVQLQVFAPKPGALPERGRLYDGAVALCAAPMCAVPRRRESESSSSMGLAAGGSIQQKVYPDPYGIETWDPHNTARCFVHIVNTEMWREITGEAPPRTPVTAREYARHGLPWFSLYDEEETTLSASSTLANVKSVREIDAGKSTRPLQDDATVAAGPIKTLLHKLAPRARGNRVRDGKW